MTEVMVKTHLIITDIRDEYHMNWCGKVMDIHPAFTDKGLLKFAIINSEKRVEFNTLNMNELEEMAKKITSPKGRSAVTKDIARIYIIDQNQEEKLLGVLTHNRIKSFAPMYDKMGYR